jgi:hypothetical protein
VIFYVITNGSTANFLSSNPTNGSGGPQALLSFDAANPDGANHFRWFSPGQQQTDPDANELHVSDKVGGGEGEASRLSVGGGRDAGAAGGFSAVATGFRTYCTTKVRLPLAEMQRPSTLAALG